MLKWLWQGFRDVVWCTLFHGKHREVVCERSAVWYLCRKCGWWELR